MKMPTTKQLMKYLKHPIEMPYEGPLQMDGYNGVITEPNINFTTDKDITIPALKTYYLIDSPYNSTYGTGVQMNLYYDKGHWYLGDNGNMDMARHSLAFDECVPKSNVELFNQDIKYFCRGHDIQNKYHHEYYVCQLVNGLKDLNRAYVKQVMFQIHYLDIMWFLQQNNQGTTSISVHLPKNK